MVARPLCLANAFPCKCISQQGREREASAAPAGCLEICVLCLLLSFGAGWRMLVARRGWAMSPAARCCAGCCGGAVLLVHQILVEEQFAQEHGAGA